MKLDWLEAYCKSKPGVEQVWKAEWEATLYKVDDKLFLMDGGDKQGKHILTVKLLPEEGALARSVFSAVVPGYYMNKTHWNSVYVDGDVDEAAMRGFIDQSYRLIVESLSKKRQKELLA